MGSFLCKIWMFFLKLVDSVVDGIGWVLIGLVNVIGHVLSAIWDAIDGLVDDVLGSGSTLLWLLAGGLLLWFILGRKEDGDENLRITSA